MCIPVCGIDDGLEKEGEKGRLRGGEMVGGWKRRRPTNPCASLCSTSTLFEFLPLVLSLNLIHLFSTSSPYLITPQIFGSLSFSQSSSFITPSIALSIHSLILTCTPSSISPFPHHVSGKNNSFNYNTLSGHL